MKNQEIKFVAVVEKYEFNCETKYNVIGSVEGSPMGIIHGGLTIIQANALAKSLNGAKVKTISYDRNGKLFYRAYYHVFNKMVYYCRNINHFGKHPHEITDTPTVSGKVERIGVNEMENWFKRMDTMTNSYYCAVKNNN